AASLPSLPLFPYPTLFRSGVLNMCGHGTIGVAVALGHLGRIGAGRHRLETPVGVVAFDYDGANRVTLENVPSYRLATDVIAEVRSEEHTSELPSLTKLPFR